MRKLVVSILLILTAVMPVRVSSQEVVEEQSYHQAMTLGFDKITELENFQLDFEMVYTDTGIPVYSGIVYGNQETGDIELQVDFYDNLGSDEEPVIETYPFHLYAYEHFYLVYTNQIEWLNHLGLSDIPLVTPETIEFLESNEETVTPIESAQLAQHNEPVNTLKSFLMLPDPNQIDEIATEFISYEDGVYEASMERLEIPVGLFQEAGSFELDYLIDLKLRELIEEQTFAVDIGHNFSYNRPSRGVLIDVGTISNIQQIIAGLREPDLPMEGEAPSENEPADLNHQFTIRSRDVTEKLTKAQWELKPSEDYYHVELTGIAERININVFGARTSKLNAANVTLEMTLTPTDYDIPAVETLETMNQRELVYMLQRLMAE